MINTNNKLKSFFAYFAIFFIIHFLISNLIELLRSIKGTQNFTSVEFIDSLVFSLVMAIIFQFTAKSEQK
jgi:hypothetical protein